MGLCQVFLSPSPKWVLIARAPASPGTALLLFEYTGITCAYADPMLDLT
jgi:hypothetical protein